MISHISLQNNICSWDYIFHKLKVIVDFKYSKKQTAVSNGTKYEHKYCIHQNENQMISDERWHDWLLNLLTCHCPDKQLFIIESPQLISYANSDHWHGMQITLDISRSETQRRVFLGLDFVIYASNKYTLPLFFCLYPSK